MKYAIGCLLTTCLLMAACARKVEEKPADPLNVAYEMRTFKVQSDNCKTDSAACATFSVAYPEFPGLDMAVQRALRAQIDTVVTRGYGEGPSETFEQTARAFINDYQTFQSEMPDASGGWYYSSEAKVSVANDSLISLTVYQEDYSGGAHPNALINFINIDPRTGERITLEDFFIPGFGENLTQTGERIFRREKSLSDTASLAANNFEFENDKFRLNDNYGFTNEGIVFYFNNYEIAAYAAGPTEIRIPYAEVKDWLKK